MSDEIFRLLSLQRLPGRLTTEQAAAVVGFMPHDLPVLVRSRLLKPLGNPRPCAVKFYAATEIEKYARDPQWLHRATRTVYANWEKQNQNRREKHNHVKTLIAA